MSGVAIGAWIAGAYLLGSISFAQAIARAKGVDLRAVGSGNLGATNAARALGRGWGMSIYILDCAKGLLPVLAARHLGDDASILSGWTLPLSVVVGSAAILGHCLPLWHGFRGGKGAATASGVLAGLSAPVFGIGMVIFLLAVAISRMISVGSIIGGLALPVIWIALERRHALEGRGGAVLAFLLLAMTLILVTHRKNMERIVRGEEPKIGGGRKA